ncbi:MAG: hypothetical protein SGI77_11805 [Pirellulaceae bacterium]|nr:hypothetical protein [Pirellulaceae bacterium]
MDPEVTWLGMIQALIDDDREAASDFANCLVRWLDSGGFPPKVLPDLGNAARDPDSPAYLLDRMIVFYVCARVRTTF